jgi:hypothetical protein
MRVQTDLGLYGELWCIDGIELVMGTGLLDRAPTTTNHHLPWWNCCIGNYCADTYEPLLTTIKHDQMYVLTMS